MCAKPPSSISATGDAASGVFPNALLHNLADGGARELGDDQEVLGNELPGEMAISQVPDHLLKRERFALAAQFDDGTDLLAQPGVGDADDCCRPHPGMLLKQRFDLDDGHVLAAPALHRHAGHLAQEGRTRPARILGAGR